MAVYQLPREPIFPHPDEATPDGLLGIGGDLSPRRLVAAYASGIFPWYNNDDPILWWSPDPRMIIYPDKFKLAKSLRQRINKKQFNIRIDFAFEEVIEQCKTVKRKDANGTWITNEMADAYIRLHQMGIAHSVETWEGNKLVGGLYGVSLGSVFFGESMFHKRTDASKVAFYHLTVLAQKIGFEFIDCQVSNEHLLSLGAEEIPRDNFLDMLDNAMVAETLQGNWGKFEKLLL